MSTAHYGRAVPVGLRRFPKLNVKIVKDSKKVKLPNHLPPGFHIVLLMFKNNHHWEASTWNGLYNRVTQLVEHAYKSILKENNINNNNNNNINDDDHHSSSSSSRESSPCPNPPQLYYLWVFSRFKWLWSYLWIKRCKEWVLLNKNKLPFIDSDNILVAYTDKEWFEKRLGIINDGRPYILLMKNNGKILFCHHGHYDPNLHDFGISKAVREEMEREENNIIKITAKTTDQQHIPLLLQHKHEDDNKI